MLSLNLHAPPPQRALETPPRLPASCGDLDDTAEELLDQALRAFDGSLCKQVDDGF